MKLSCLSNSPLPVPPMIALCGIDADFEPEFTDTFRRDIHRATDLLLPRLLSGQLNLMEN